MLRLPDIGISQDTRNGLLSYQSRVNAGGSFARQVDLAKNFFKTANKSTNPTFRDVRQQLTTMCGGQGRCCYCELSQPDEVEHVRPKDLYPESAFEWENYVFACGICNGTWKSNKFAIIDSNGYLVDVTRGRTAAVIPPTNGNAALISPRLEDPLALLELDIIDTFLFLPSQGLGTVEFLRAEYSIKLLGLNQRPILPRARANAFGAYRARLTEYLNERDSGATTDQLSELREDILNSPHPFVWREMQRQPNVRQDLKQLFHAVPEAISW